MSSLRQFTAWRATGTSQEVLTPSGWPLGVHPVDICYRTHSKPSRRRGRIRGRERFHPINPPIIARSISTPSTHIYTQLLYPSDSTWVWVTLEADDHPPMETSGRAAIAAYTGCDVDDCALPQSIGISDVLRCYPEPAPAVLRRPEPKPYYDIHVEGSHLALVGFLVFEHCQCEPGYTIRHGQMLLRAQPDDFRQVQGIYLDVLRE